MLELDPVEICDINDYNNHDKNTNTYESQYISIIVDSNENVEKSSFESDTGLETIYDSGNIKEDQYLDLPISLIDSSFR